MDIESYLFVGHGTVRNRDLPRNFHDGENSLKNAKRAPPKFHDV